MFIKFLLIFSLSILGNDSFQEGLNYIDQKNHDDPACSIPLDLNRSIDHFDPGGDGCLDGMELQFEKYYEVYKKSSKLDSSLSLSKDKPFYDRFSKLPGGLLYDEVYLPETASLILNFCSDFLIETCKVQDRDAQWRDEDGQLDPQLGEVDWFWKKTKALKKIDPNNKAKGINTYDYALYLKAKSLGFGGRIDPVPLTFDETEFLESFKFNYYSSYYGDYYEPLLNYDPDEFEKYKCPDTLSLRNAAIRTMNPFDDPIFEAVSLGALTVGTRLSKKLLKFSSKILIESIQQVSKKISKSALNKMSKKELTQYLIKAGSLKRKKAIVKMKKQLFERKENFLRIKKAQTFIGRKISKMEKEALIKAHLIGKSRGAKVGEFTKEEIAEKIKILKDAGFNKQIRTKDGKKVAEWNLLMKKGIAGSGDEIELTLKSQQIIDSKIGSAIKNQWSNTKKFLDIHDGASNIDKANLLQRDIGKKFFEMNKFASELAVSKFDDVYKQKDFKKKINNVISDISEVLRDASKSQAKALNKCQSNPACEELQQSTRTLAENSTHHYKLVLKTYRKEVANWRQSKEELLDYAKEFHDGKFLSDFEYQELVQVISNGL